MPASCTRPADGPVVPVGYPVGVAARSQEVVASGAERDEVGVEGACPWHLAFDDLVDQCAADGEVGVGEGRLRALPGQMADEAVGPADQCAVRGCVAEPFGETVADCHVRRDAGIAVRVVHSHVIRLAFRCLLTSLWQASWSGAVMAVNQGRATWADGRAVAGGAGCAARQWLRPGQVRLGPGLRAGKA